MFPLLTTAIAIAFASWTRTETPAADCRHLPPTSARVAIPNDNRDRAGVVRSGVLTVHLVARPAAWRPDGSTGCALAVHAFAEEGRPAQIPGPLLRMRRGTEVHVSVRNALTTSIWMRGLQDRAPGTLDSVEIAPGVTHSFHFVAKTAGPWIYWAGGKDSQLIAGDANGQLVGAMIVDSADASGIAPKSDRVLVLTRWKADGKGDNDGFQLNAFNGRSWPNSERLRYTVGDSVRWHVLNASNASHEMHLHGFFFRLEARGTSGDTVRATPTPSVGDLRVTSVMRPGEWLTMSWSPDRAGNWHFHCHLLTHMNGDQRPDRMPGAAAATGGHEHGAGASENGADHDMARLVLGLDVRPAPVRSGRAAVAPALKSSRSIDLFASARARTFGEKDGYGFVVHEGATAPARDSIRIPGSPLILTRGEPVRIAIHNRLTMPISVHWHGVELESYFDGVGGFSGSGTRIAPMIASNDSFVVRFTPPRAGTFMYHVHGERGEELASGLYGPLLVVDPSTRYDSNTDRYFMMADGGPGSPRPLFINGSTAPDTMELVIGTTYRLRFMWIAANNVLTTTLRDRSGPVMVRGLAYDGHDQSPVISFPLRLSIGPGHTGDFEFTPTEPGNMTLELAYGPNTGVTNVPATIMPIRVPTP